MPGARRGPATLALLASLITFNAAAIDLEEGPRGARGLQRNPFERPAPPPAPAVEARAAPEPPPPVVWKPELRATLVAGTGSSANVDGRILVVGQQIEGFRLIEIRERKAVFEKDGVRRVLDMETAR